MGARESLRIIEGGVERALLAEIRAVIEAEWPIRCALRDASEDAYYGATLSDGCAYLMEYRGWTISIRSSENEAGDCNWRPFLELFHETRERRHLVAINPFPERAFTTKARADEAGAMLGRAWIDRRGNEEQFKPRKRRAGTLNLAGECRLSLEATAERFEVTPEAMTRWIRRQLEGLGKERRAGQ